ncbi:MAG TPA: tol-pal system protein YbgF [candidate division Zixibacteria bacterium]|nr:tol-pal system protein YbgF [candidate division Zixibacteria bacterium]
MKRIIYFLSISSLLFLTGCASRQEIVRFKEQLNYLEESNARLDSLLAAQNELMQKLRADFKSSLSEINERLTASENKLDDLSYFFSQSIKKLESSPKPNPPVDTSAKKNSNPPSIQVNARELYETSYLDLTKGKYDLAISGFTEFLKNFPNSELTDNAQYWLAQSYYAKEDFNQAIPQYKKLLETYPGSDKTPDCLYKLGLCYVAMKNTTQANKYFKEVVDKYPSSTEAKLAREKLGLKKK